MTARDAADTEALTRAVAADRAAAHTAARERVRVAAALGLLARAVAELQDAGLEVDVDIGVTVTAP